MVPRARELQGWGSEAPEGRQAGTPTAVVAVGPSRFEVVDLEFRASLLLLLASVHYGTG